MSKLNLDPEALGTCVQCGLCLPHCPTYRVTGDESRSPRGRIALMRAVEYEGAPLTPEVRDSFETCVMCRGCEPACPSNVPFGALMEGTRESMVRLKEMTPFWQRAALEGLLHPKPLRAATAALATAQRAHLVPKRLGLTARLPFRRPARRTSGSDVYLFTGCVMDAWQRDVHDASQFVLEQAGCGVEPTGDASPCCGALHLHAGLADRGRQIAQGIMEALHGDRPIVVDSAGCGAALKDYGHLLGTEEGRRFSERVFDVSEWLAPRVDQLPQSRPLDVRVAVQDPCHLRHVQRVHQSTRVLVRPFVRELVELDDEGLCCGAGGAYSVMQSELASMIRDRKLGAIARAEPDVVMSANPGCSMHLAAAGVHTVHPVTLVASALAPHRFSLGI